MSTLAPLPGMGGDFAKGASGPANVYDTSPAGLGLNPAYLAGGAIATAASSASSGGTLVSGTRAANVSTAGTAFGTGADILAAALTFAADGTSSYVVTWMSYEVDTGGIAQGVSAWLNLDGAQGNAFITGNGLVNGMPVFVQTLIPAPAAGSHTVNVRIFANGAWTVTALGAANSPQIVRVSVR